MKNPFKIISLPNQTWAVSWPEIGNITSSATRSNLINEVFAEIQPGQRGFGLMQNNGEVDIVWITDTETAQFNQYQRLYDIGGVVFFHKQDAYKFQKYLEKKLIIKALMTG